MDKDNKKGKDKKKDSPKKDTKKDKVPKVSPSKDKGQNDVKSKAQSMLLNHPQITQNARGLFRNENGKTIVEEIVHRGDPKVLESIMPRNQGDLTDEDLRSLAVHASTMVDKNISKYDPILASEDALSMAIRTKDGGKYDGKISASTYQLILDNMKGMKKTAEDSKKVLEPETDLEPENDTEEESDKPSALDRGKENVKKSVKKLQEGAKSRKEEKAKKETEKPLDNTPEEGTMDKEMLKREAAALKRKLAAIEELVGEEDDGEKDAAQGPGEIEDGQAESVYKDPAEPDKGDSDGCDKNPITSSLDEIAAELEKQKDPELFKMAYQLDQISDILEGKKEAATFESDPDEKFMKTFFKGGLREGDSDEPYMKEFNTDLTKEVLDVKDKKNGKEASEKLPYQKLA